MAAKTKKRKLFDVRTISDLEEVVEIVPVFNRVKKTQKQASLSETSDKNAISLVAKEQKTAEESNEECSNISDGSVGKPCLQSVNSGTETVLQDERNTDDGDVHVGRNFLETFAFIEKTKFYEEPKSSRTTCSSTGAVSSESNTEQNIPVKSSNPNAIIVNQRQKGNPVLKFFQNVPWEYGDVIPDYVMGPRMCALFLSIRYHNFNPNYIHERLKQLGNRYELRILLVQVDNKDPHKTLKELTKIAILADCTLILAWSAEEAARYIEMYKIYENKPPDALQGQASTDYMSKLADCLTTIKSVNKTNTVTLISTFQSLKNIISASKDDLALCPGFGPQKAKRLHDAFHQPFIISKKDSSDSSKK